MRSSRLTTLGLSVALLGLLAHLALAGPADNVSSLVRQGTVITVDAHDQATLQLDDGTTFTVPEKPWQHGWKVGDRVNVARRNIPCHRRRPRPGTPPVSRTSTRGSRG